MQEDFESFDDFDDDVKSKSQIKREFLALQALGEKIVNMGAHSDKIPLDDALLEAIELARRINRKKDSYRRQIQYIGKLLRNRDVAPIEEAINKIENKHQIANRHFHQLEKWRERILRDQDVAINALIAEQPEADRQRLRKYVRNAQKQAELNQPPTASRELFQYLRELFPQE
ncbi:ribosome biogenesis factor YjgA [Pseudobowmanella zhangzhouensis]|nr:hypothetical protein TK45_09860 [Bowmanella sp. JS7-9]